MLHPTNMKFLAIFFLAVSAVNSFPVDSYDCFKPHGKDCMKMFMNGAFSISNEQTHKCSELEKFVDCLGYAVDECFGIEQNEEMNMILEQLDDFYQDSCGAIASGDGFDFDDETYSEFQLKVTIQKKKKEISSSTTGQKEISSSTSGVRSDSKKCFRERAHTCYDDFTTDAVYDAFFSEKDVDKCKDFQFLILCIRRSANYCYEDEHHADHTLEFWETIRKFLCEATVTSEKSVSSTLNLTDADLQCNVSEWSQWSPCSVTCGNGIKARTREYLKHFESQEEWKMCLDHAKLWQNVPCIANCTVNTIETETSSSVLTATEECFEGKLWTCKNDVFKDIFGDFFSLDHDPNKCRPIQVMLECYRRAAEDCFKDDHDERVNSMLEEFENQSESLCEADGADNKAFTVFLIDVLLADYQRREKCVDENENYIYNCYRNTMFLMDANSCGYWENFVGCTTRKISIKCGEEASRRFKDRLPDITESIKKQCKFFCIICGPDTSTIVI